MKRESYNSTNTGLGPKRYLIFWCLLLICFTLIQFFKDGNEQRMALIFLQNLKRLPAMFVAAYVFNFVWIPRFWKKKQYLVFMVMSGLLFYFTGALDRMVNVYLYEPIFREGTFSQEPVSEIFSDIPHLITSYLPPLLTATLAMTLTNIVYESNETKRHALELQRDKNRAELNALKAQIHPHFLFNTLNNLYALTVQKSDKAPKMVEALASILDYILYKCNDRFVPLGNEIKLIKDYMALEHLRFGDAIELDCSLDYNEDIHGDVRIAPLLLLSIVENAFKHGASGQLKQPKIWIRLSIAKKTLYFRVKNTKNQDLGSGGMGYTKGIGVTNLRQQLSKLYEEYSFQNNDQTEMYEVELVINTLSAYD
ncbi:hypothetical protein FGF1_00730 [Flavobacteriaceae bacterium GF1]